MKDAEDLEQKVAVTLELHVSELALGMHYEKDCSRNGGEL